MNPAQEALGRASVADSPASCAVLAGPAGQLDAPAAAQAPSLPAAPEALPIGRSSLPGPISGPAGTFQSLPAPADQAGGAFLPVAGAPAPAPPLADSGPFCRPCGKGDDDRKAYATAQARAALSGYGLTRSDPADGPVTYIVTRWTLARSFAGPYGLDAVEEFLDRAAGPAHAA